MIEDKLDRIIHILQRLADAPPQESEPEPARRGRVVKPEELREGDVYDIDGRGEHSSMTDLNVDLGFDPNNFFKTDEIRLISRKPPEPEEHRFIILHGTRCGFEGPEPAAWNDDDMYLGESFGYGANEITDWSPARVVPAGQEA